MASQISFKTSVNADTDIIACALAAYTRFVFAE